MSSMNFASENPRDSIQTLSTSLAGIAISVSSALFSLVGSLLIIYLILKSTMGLKTAYHRIMFSISICDVLQSCAIALATLPMPKDMIYEFDGLALGNHRTCNLQGFTIVLAAVMTVILNASLCIFYFFTIVRRWPEKKYRKIIEPAMYIFAVLFSSYIAITGLLTKQFNPNPLRFTWCAYSQYPYWCVDEDCEEEHGNPEGALVHFNMANLMVVACVLIVIISMITITLHVYKQEKLLQRYVTNTNSLSNRRLVTFRSNLVNTKLIVKQALFYTLAFLFMMHHPLL